MRRFFLGMAIASLTAGAPLTAFGGDREIADAIITAVKQSQVSLSGLEVDLTVENGNVLITGTAASQSQLDRVLTAARDTDGVKSVDNQAKVVAHTPATIPSAPSAVVPASANEAPTLLIEDESASASDSQITSDILGQLGQAKKVGQLRNFDLDVSTVDGEVWVRGNVASQQQKDLVLGTAQRTSGVRRVMDEVVVTGVRTVSGQVPSNIVNVPQVQVSPQGVNVGNGAVAAPAASPRAFAPSNLNGGMGGMPVSSGVVAPQAPMPMNAGPSYGAGVPRHDNPNMPGYAWPSYAAHPNYAAVTYPKQYSASAWPYIGPFYPYPQVPLGWRRVSLEWDDGLWYLDFTHK
ncbi:MAG: BON domain-containing protein [Pirellula sp.]|jgi:osmotically-inducible protein OsmY|nr:BON domain-containing protein [Pirellula sp.]